MKNKWLGEGRQGFLYYVTLILLLEQNTHFSIIELVKEYETQCIISAIFLCIEDQQLAQSA